MATPLNAVGTLSYNGVEFGVLHQSSMTGTPVYDEPGHVVKWVQWAIEVTGWISNTAGTGGEMEVLRARLTKPACELKYTDKGFGTFHVNGTSKVLDADWGPKPRLISWMPLGGAQGCRVVWRVETCIPECPDTADYDGIAAIWYGMDFEIDQDGYTTRTVSGGLEIAQTRPQPARLTARVMHNADEYRDRIRPDVPKGFQRVSQRFNLSPSKNKLTYNFVDKEIPSPLPKSCTTFELTETIDSSIQDAFQNWRVNFSGRCVVSRDAPKSRAWDSFVKVIGSRLLNKFGGDAAGLEKAFRGETDAYFGLENLRVSEEVVGRATSVDASFLLIKVGSIQAALSITGLWRPVEGTDYVVWLKSLRETASHERGFARMAAPVGEEIIVDLCDQEKPKPPTDRPKEDRPIRPGIRPDPPATGPKPEKSWWRYRNFIEIRTRNRVARHPLLDLPERRQIDYLAIDPDVDAGGGGHLGPARQQNIGPADRPSFLRGAQSITSTGAGAEQTADSYTPEPKSPSKEQIQDVGGPVYDLIMWGDACRLGHKIPIPRLVSVGGVTLTQIFADVSETISGSVGGVHIHEAAWYVEYALPEKLKSILPNILNPVYGIG
jgi:hypothetical protein